MGKYLQIKAILIFGSLILLLLSLIFGKIFKGFADLSFRGKAIRVLGITGATIATFTLVFALFKYEPPSMIQWTYSLEQGLKTARQEKKPVIIDFWANWCAKCKQLDRETFSDREVQKEAQRFVMIKLDFTDEDEKGEAIKKRYDVKGLPTVLFLDNNQKIQPQFSFFGFIKAGELLKKMRGKSLQTDDFEQYLQKGGILIFLFVFLSGILASFTPCVYPIIPITIKIFGSYEAKSKLQAFGLSLIFVLGLATTYTILGVVASTTGSLFGEVMQSRWVNLFLVLIFMLMGLSSLGLFELNLPTSLQQKMSKTGGASYLQIFVMGLFAGVIASPCVGPILVGILTYVAKTQNILFGSSLLFVFAVGMGLLFMVLGTFTQLVKKIPKSGAWMEGVKAIFSVVLFTFGLYYLNDAFPKLMKGLFGG